MGKASRSKRDKGRGGFSAPQPAERRLPLPWIAGAVVVVAIGALLVVISRGDDRVPPLANEDHWHTAFGVNVCGTFLPDPPTFDHQAERPTVRAGVHTHGDGLIHVHPYATAEAGERATVGRYFDHGGWELGSDAFRAWDGRRFEDGDECPDGRPGRVRWSLDGVEQDGNLRDHRPQSGEVIVLGFVPDGDDLGVPSGAFSELITFERELEGLDPYPDAAVPGEAPPAEVPVDPPVDLPEEVPDEVPVDPPVDEPADPDGEPERP